MQSLTDHAPNVEPVFEPALVNRYRLWWEAAATDFPCIVMGMGRWGKVLAGVLHDARGTGDGIYLVARSNASEIEDWSKVRVRGATVASSFAAVPRHHVDRCRENGFAIVASDPARHLADWMLMRAAGLPVLVEKPLSIDPASIEIFVREADRLPATGVGIEFAMLPVWSCLQALLEAPVDHVEIVWADMEGELRYGDVKRRHPGVDLLTDLSHHLASILAHFCKVATLRITARTESANQASLTLAALDVPSLRVNISAAASSRQRTFMLQSGGAIWEVDFGVHAPTLLRNGRPVRLPTELLGFNSSLRLELGAFLLRARDQNVAAPMTDWLGSCASLHVLLVSGRAAPGPLAK